MYSIEDIVENKNGYDWKITTYRGKYRVRFNRKYPPITGKKVDKYTRFDSLDYDTVHNAIDDVCEKVGIPVLSITDDTKQIVQVINRQEQFDPFEYAKTELYNDINYLSNMSSENRTKLVSSRLWVSVPMLESIRRCIYYIFPRTMYSRDLRNKNIGRYVNRLKNDIISGFWKDIGIMLTELELTGRDIFSMMVSVVGSDTIRSKIPSGIIIEEVVDLEILNTANENFVAVQDLEERVSTLEVNQEKLKLEIELLKSEFTVAKLLFKQIVPMLDIYKENELLINLIDTLEGQMSKIDTRVIDIVSSPKFSLTISL